MSWRRRLARRTHKTCVPTRMTSEDRRPASNECIQVRDGARLHSQRSETVQPYVPTSLPVEGVTCRKRCPAPGTNGPRSRRAKARRRTNAEPCARISNFLRCTMPIPRGRRGCDAADDDSGTERVVPVHHHASSTTFRAQSPQTRPSPPNHPSGPVLSIPSAPGREERGRAFSTAGFNIQLSRIVGGQMCRPAPYKGTAKISKSNPHRRVRRDAASTIDAWL
jgi:hypothetical protein